MKTRIFLLLALAGLSSILASAGEPPDVIAEDRRSDQLVVLKFRSAAIAAGSLADRPVRSLAIRLPASYGRDETRRYPVVYTFHGYGDSYLQLINLLPALERQLGRAAEFIMVGIDGDNRYGGSFYANSALTGFYEDMVTGEVLPLVDSRYRTAAGPRGRMVAGFSMGGGAAWNLALAHPGLFCGAWVCCPGAFDATGLRDALGMWDNRIRTAYGSAFAAGTDRKPRAPRFDGSPEDRELVRLWENGFGNAAEKLAAYARAGAALQEVRFDYGRNDPYDWIPRGTAALAKAFAEAGIACTVQEHAAGHDIGAAMLAEGFAPLVKRLFGADAF
jgi:enterochelin esterase-like enzyme